MSSASPSLTFAVGLGANASPNSAQPQPSDVLPNPQDSSNLPPPTGGSPAIPSPSPPLPPPNPPMASPPPILSSPPPAPTVSPPPPLPATIPPPQLSSPPPISSPPPVNPPTISPPPPVNPPTIAPPPPPLVPTYSPPPPSTNYPPPPPQLSNSPPPPVTTSSPPPKPPESPPPPPSPPPPQYSPPPPPPRQSPPPPPPSIRPFPHPRGTPRTDSSSGNEIDLHSPSDGGIGTGGAVALALVFSLVFLAVMGIACCLRRRKKASGRSGAYIMPTSSQESDPRMSKPNNGSGSGLDIICSPHEPGGGFGNSRSWFNYDELVQATNGFSAQNLLGVGGFGSVYKGVLENGRDVAVKQLKIGGGQGEREFRSEVEIISRIHHRHLVALVGYCINQNRRLLVYDYVANDNLYFHLHGEGRPVLSWDVRVKISLGAARGIAYLHEDCHPRIIHRDIKSSNILLDSNFEAQVSDFGLAKLALDSSSHVTTRVMGTIGYMAPEYASSGKLTERSDVYSFGVVLLELITGRKPVDKSHPSGAESLVEWARPLLSRALETEDFSRLVDPRLEQQYTPSEMFRMIEAAAACVRHSFNKRPKMGQVVRALDTMATTDLTNGMRVGESEMFDPATQSAELQLFRRMAFGTQDDISTGFFES